MLGIAAISVGATAGVLLPGQGDEAIAAEPSLAAPSLAAESLDAPQVLTVEPEVEPSATIEPEVVEAVATPAIGPSLVKHRVQDGDTLWALAQSYGVPPEAIAASNSIDSSGVLTVGQTLKIPTAVAPQAAAEPAQAIAAVEPDAVSEPVAEAAPEPEQPELLASTAPQTASDDRETAAAADVEESGDVATSRAWREARAQQAASEMRIYRVQAGDTLDRIATRLDVSSLELAQLNQITDPRRLQPGQRLKVPASDEAQAEVATTPRLVAPTRAARETANERTVAAQPSLSNNSHIDKLKDDVMRMREEIRNQRQGASAAAVEPEVAAESAEPEVVSEPVARRLDAPVLLNSTLETRDRSQPRALAPVERRPEVAARTEQPAERQVRQERPRAIAAAPVPTEAYNRLLQLPSGRTVAPELPPLQSPENYLPDRPQQFNGYIWPARGTLTSGYGPRWGRMHRGIDIAAPTGTPIFAAAPGEVIAAGWNNGGFGNLVDIRHPDGSMTRYAHNSRVLVRKGQRVEQGEKIALMGSTGFSTGPHLHFEIHPAGRGATNPMAFLPRSRR